MELRRNELRLNGVLGDTIDWPERTTAEQHQLEEKWNYFEERKKATSVGEKGRGGRREGNWIKAKQKKREREASEEKK